MKTYLVEGTAQVLVSIEVEAESQDEAIEVAYDMQIDLDSYCGNGGMNKLVGTSLDECGVYPMGITYDSVTEI